MKIFQGKLLSEKKTKTSDLSGKQEHNSNHSHFTIFMAVGGEMRLHIYYTHFKMYI